MPRGGRCVSPKTHATSAWRCRVFLPASRTAPRRIQSRTSTSKKTPAQPGDSALLPFEKQVYAGLFEDGDAVELSDLKNKFYEDLAEAQKDLYADAVQRSWFSRDPEASRGWTQGAGVVLIATGVGLGWMLGNVGAAIVGVSVVLLGVFVLLAGSGLMSQADMYRLGGVVTAFNVVLYLTLGTMWLLLVAR